jgi:hypothetical protein
VCGDACMAFHPVLIDFAVVLELYQPRPHRRLLRQAALQLQDEHGNAAPAAGLPIRWRLTAVDVGGNVNLAEAAEAPTLLCSEGSLQLVSDERGRAFFGDLAVEEGTGRVVRLLGGAGHCSTACSCLCVTLTPFFTTDAATATVSACRNVHVCKHAALLQPLCAPHGLECLLEVQVLLSRPSRRRSSMPSATWLTVWQRPVLFSDDAARVRELQARYLSPLV